MRSVIGQNKRNRSTAPKHPLGVANLAGVKQLKMPQKRKRDVTSGVVDRLIEMKVKCNFSINQLEQIILLHQPANAKSISKLVRKELREDYSAYRLHGCAQCEDFIWIAGENQPCDNCNNQDGRSPPPPFTI